jgi:hypothetical protein
MRNKDEYMDAFNFQVLYSFDELCIHSGDITNGPLRDSDHAIRESSQDFRAEVMHHSLSIL